MPAWKRRAAPGGRQKGAINYITVCINLKISIYSGLAAAAEIDGFVTCTPD
jgi:hypothetical protein